MSNRRKARQQRVDQPNYGVKSRGRRPMFNFDFLKSGRFGEFGNSNETEPAPARRDRTLSGKDRVRARRGKR